MIIIIILWIKVSTTTHFILIFLCAKLMRIKEIIEYNDLTHLLLQFSETWKENYCLKIANIYKRCVCGNFVISVFLLHFMFDA